MTVLLHPIHIISRYIDIFLSLVCISVHVNIDVAGHFMDLSLRPYHSHYIILNYSDISWFFFSLGYQSHEGRCMIISNSLALLLLPLS